MDAKALTDLKKIHPDLVWNLARDTQKVNAAIGSSLGARGTVNGHLNLKGIACNTTLHVFSRLNTSLLSKSTCIKLGLLKEGWPSSHVLPQKTDRIQKISVDRVYDKPVSHTPHAFDGNERLESTLVLLSIHSLLTYSSMTKHSSLVILAGSLFCMQSQHTSL